MISFNEALAQLQDSPEYKEWESRNKHSYLSYGFVMLDPVLKEEWQIGFYNPLADRLTSFSVGEKTTRNPDSEVFKDKKVLRLYPERVKIKVDEAVRKADNLQKEKYPAYTPLKKIVLIQHLEMGTVWNITFVTGTFKTLNMKIDASTGNILKYDLLDFFRVEK